MPFQQSCLFPPAFFLERMLLGLANPEKRRPPDPLLFEALS
jgi:hypothetical protein